jgi:hypothetical protein
LPPKSFDRFATLIIDSFGKVPGEKSTRTQTKSVSDRIANRAREPCNMPTKVSIRISRFPSGMIKLETT